MPDLMTEYIRFPTIESFERFLYSVAYSSRVPAHVKLKRSNILIWRDYQNNSLRISFSSLIYSDIVTQFLNENERTQLFQPASYYVLRYNREMKRWDQLFLVQGRVARIQLDEPTKLNRACQILRDYLYYTTFTRSLTQLSYHDKRRLEDCLEAVQGYY